MPPTTRNRVTLSDIASAAQVSVPAASMALSNHPSISLRTRRKVWEISQRLGYRRSRQSPAAHHASSTRKPSRLSYIALGASLARPITAHCLLYATAFGSRAGIRLEAACVEDLSDPRHAVERVLALIEPHEGVALADRVDDYIIRAVAATGIPLVVIGDPVGDVTADVVTFDHEAGGRLLASRLLSKGHQRIAFVCDTLLRGGANTRWLDGYRLAHLDAGVTADPTLVHVSGQVDAGAVEGLVRLLDQPKPPTAIISVNVPQTHALAHELAKRNLAIELCTVRIEEELMGTVTAHLPGIIYPIKDLCETAMKRLLYLCEHPGEPPITSIVPYSGISMR